ncbi:MAG: hypothetical protein HYX92_22140 [Chloroflexi bacterium]|nr:hypothetical protein [Chloroflexota bacterium]
MSKLEVRLFGSFDVRYRGENVGGLVGRKVRELFCYLLLHRDHPHSREVLADLLWSDCDAVHSRAYLRKALWQLQATLESMGEVDRVLQVGKDWIQVCSGSHVWTDVERFEHAFTLTQNLRGVELDPPVAESLETAVALYRGDLLEGWYQDWCLFERDRLRERFLAALHRLMIHCETCGDYEKGLSYGMRILNCDPARERAHQGVMRLHCLAGDKTAALRHYERCVAALDKELGVPPDTQTVTLYRQIQTDQLPGPARRPASTGPPEPFGDRLREVSRRLRHVQAVLVKMETEVQRDIDTVERLLNVQC